MRRERMTMRIERLESVPPPPSPEEPPLAPYDPPAPAPQGGAASGRAYGRRDRLPPVARRQRVTAAVASIGAGEQHHA
jgi:hypothetical protein